VKLVAKIQDGWRAIRIQGFYYKHCYMFPVIGTVLWILFALLFP
jgi:hypothetical protein